MHWDEYSVTSALFLPNKEQSESNHKETSRKAKLWDGLQNNFLVIFKMVKIMKVKNTEELFQIDED